MRRVLLTVLLPAALALSACGAPAPDTNAFAQAAPGRGGDHAELNRLIDQYAREYQVPSSLVHRVVRRESNYNPAARNGPYMGLMQILPQTAQTMGHRGGAQSLLDAETNLRYGVKYLRGAWLVADGSEDKAVSWYSRGYYYEAKRRGLLEEAGLRPAR